MISSGNGGIRQNTPIISGFGLIARLRRPGVTGTNQDKVVWPDFCHHCLKHSISGSTGIGITFKYRPGQPISLIGATPSGAYQESLTRGEHAA